MTITFGTDGWRGIIGEDFTEANVRLVARAILDVLRHYDRQDGATPGQGGIESPRLVVGHDCRRGGETFARAVAVELAAGGARPTLVEGFATTPSLGWLTTDTHSDGAMVVTASHNPPRYNGLKFKTADGGSASPEITSRFEERVAALEREAGGGAATGDATTTNAGSAGDATTTNAGSAGDTTTTSAAVETLPSAQLKARYLAALRRLSRLGERDLAGWHVVVDPLYGAGRGWLSELLAAYGAEVTEIHADADPDFGGLLPEPIPPHVAGLQAKVRDTNAVLGFALDGDADRLGAVAGDGRFVSSHEIFAILLWLLVEKRGLTGRVVKTVSTTDRVARMADAYGLELVETPVGFKYIYDQMRAGDVLIGGEESGGIGVTGHIPERDGVLMALLVAEAVREAGGSLAGLLDELDSRFGRYRYDRVDLHVAADEMRRLRERLAGFRPTEIALHRVLSIDDRDGMKYRTDAGWVMIRPSGTEDLVRTYAEAPSDDEVLALLYWARSAVHTVARP
jgi:phosphomannomutase